METLTVRLAALHHRTTANPFLQRLHLVTRLLLAMAFLPTGMVKVLGQRFTQIPIDNPIGFQGTVFFTALMLLANLFLLAWEGDRLASMTRGILSPRLSVPGMPSMEAIGWTTGAAGGFILLFETRFITPEWSIPLALGCAGVGSVFLGFPWLRKGRKEA